MTNQVGEKKLHGLLSALLLSSFIYTVVIIVVRFFLPSDLRAVILIISPFLLIILFSIFHDYQVLDAYKKDYMRLKLRNGSSVKDHESKVDSFIENFVFSRTENFKNDHRANAILVKSAYTVSLVVIVTSFFSYIIFRLVYPFITIDISLKLVEIVGAYLGIAVFINGLCWLEKSKYKEKWEYLSGMYNKIMDVQDYTKVGSDKKIEMMLNSLAIDSIVTMMWGHRSFKELVLIESKKALSHLVGTTSTSEEVLGYLLNFHFSEAEMIFILENYQRHLLGMSSVHNFPVKLKGKWLGIAKAKHFEILKK